MVEQPRVAGSVHGRNEDAGESSVSRRVILGDSLIPEVKLLCLDIVHIIVEVLGEHSLSDLTQELIEDWPVFFDEATTTRPGKSEPI